MKSVAKFVYICACIITLHFQKLDAQISLDLLSNLPLFNNNNNFQSRPKKSSNSISSQKIKCCQMVQVVSQGVGGLVLAGK
jgi:hypothetical protein